MLPLPPGRLSTMICWPRDSVSLTPIVRASVSTLPPGGNGTTRRTGRAGYCCAGAALANSATQSTSNDEKPPGLTAGPLTGRLRAQAGDLDHFRPLRNLGAERGGELFRRAPGGVGAFRGESGLHVRRPQRLVGLGVEP